MFCKVITIIVYSFVPIDLEDLLSSLMVQPVYASFDSFLLSPIVTSKIDIKFSFSFDSSSIICGKATIKFTKYPESSAAATKVMHLLKRCELKHLNLTDLQFLMPPQKSLQVS